MNRKSTSLFFAAAILPVVLLGSARAEVLASTDFDGRGLAEVNIADDTATDLNWVLNGLADPGDMTVVRDGGAGLALFNGDGAITQGMFAPAINTGNGNTFWTTSVNLAAASGSAVTLTDVTFDYWAISAAQVHNVNRRSDFTLTLRDPSGGIVDTVEILDALSGTAAGVPTIVATFSSPIALTVPGTYTLEIKGGDFAGDNETGNHTAFDNLSINGIITSSTLFAITQIDFDPVTENVSLTWSSRPGETYAVKVSEDMTDWGADLDDGVEADAGETTTRSFDLSLAAPGAARVFFRVERL